MDPGFDDLKNSQAVQMAKDTKFRRFAVRKICSGEKANSVVGSLLASTKEIRCVTHGPSQPSQQKSGIEMKLSIKDLWRILLSNGMNSRDFHGRPTKFLRMLYCQKYYLIGLKETETG